MIHTIEAGEGKTLDRSLMWPGFVLLYLGVTLSCVMLAAAGALGGYESSVGPGPVTSLRQVLSPFVYPITSTLLVAVFGGFLALLAMTRARGP